METLKLIDHGAQDVVRWFGLSAVACGLLGLLISIVLLLRYFRLGSASKRLRSISDLTTIAFPAMLRSALSGVLQPTGVVTNLTPDAAWGYIRSRLESQFESQQSVIRFLTYAPLLLGLCGTMLGLGQLLPGLNLQDRQMSVTGLHGVFYGTLLGIFGSLLGSIGGVLLGYGSSRAIASAEVFVHECVLPAIPKQRIGIRIEEAVLAEISNRTRVAVDALVDGLKPVIVQLMETAIQSGDAAQKASEAFSLAASAVREAGNLKAAAKHLSTGLQQLQESAVSFDDMLRQSREVASEQAKASDSIARVGTQMAEATRQLGTDTHSLTECVARAAGISDVLKTMIEALETTVKGQSSAVGEVSSSIEVLHQEIAALSDELKNFSGKTSGAIGADLKLEVKHLCDELDRALREIVGPVRAAEAILNQSGTMIKNDVGEARENLHAIHKELTDVSRVLGDLSQSWTRLSPQLQGADGGRVLVSMSPAEFSTILTESLKVERIRSTEESHSPAPPVQPQSNKVLPSQAVFQAPSPVANQGRLSRFMSRLFGTGQ